MEKKQASLVKIEQLFFPVTLFLTYLILLETIILIVIDKRKVVSGKSQLTTSLSQNRGYIQGTAIVPTKAPNKKTTSVWVFDTSK